MKIVNRITLFLLVLCTFQACKKEKNDSEQDSESSEKAVSNKNAAQFITSVRENNMWHFINEKGEKLFGKEFTYATDFNDGISCVAEDGDRNVLDNSVINAHYYAIDTHGKKIKGIESDQPFVFSEGRAFISSGNRKRLIDTQGKVIKEDAIAQAFSHSEGLAPVLIQGKVQFWDKDGNVIIDNIDSVVSIVSEGFILFRKNNQSGFMDKDGKIVLPPTYKNATDFHEGMAWVVTNDDKTYFINKNLEQVLGPYDDARSFSEGLAAVSKDGVGHFIDKKGNQVIEGNFKKVDDFHEGKAIVQKQDGVVGFVDKSGNFTKIDGRVALAFENGFSIAEKDGKMGFVNEKAEWVIKPKYERVNGFDKVVD